MSNSEYREAQRLSVQETVGRTWHDLGRVGRCVNTPRPLTHLVDLTNRQDEMNATCSVEGCGRDHFRNGICEPHYRRLRRTGSLGGPDFRVPKTGTSVCKADGCEKIIKGSGARGWCSTHYMRWKLHGDPNFGGPVKVQGAFIPCAAEGCDRRMCLHGYCRMHWRRVVRHGDPHLVTPQQPPPFTPSGPANVGWKGDEANYGAAHVRIKKLWGRAADHECVNCGKRAKEWAYDHCDPNPKFSERGLVYSTKPEHYMPLCHKCHAQFDWGLL